MTNFSIDYFNDMEEILKSNVIYQFLIDADLELEINKNKITEIIKFIGSGRTTKKYRIKENFNIEMDDRELKIK
jgi:hypothetical protein